MSTSPDHRRWIAAGVRQELFSRVLPALRHDMAAPASVVRMGLLLLKRQVVAATVDAAVCEKNITQLDEQVSQMVRSMRSLRDWDLGRGDDDITRTQLVTHCVGLMRARLELQGVALRVDDALQSSEGQSGEQSGDQSEGDPNWPAAVALRYLLIGALCHLHDATPTPCVIRIGAERDDALRLTAMPRAGGQVAQIESVDQTRVLPIDAAALQALADDLGYAVTIAADSVRFALAPVAAASRAA